jgi:hypothetical protein
LVPVAVLVAETVMDAVGVVINVDVVDELTVFDAVFDGVCVDDIVPV